MRIVFLVLAHKLGEGFVDDWLIFIVLLEDESCELAIMVEEVSEGEHEMMFGLIEDTTSLNLIFSFSVVVSEILNEGGELFFDLIPEFWFWHFVNGFNLHGALIIITIKRYNLITNISNISVTSTLIII